MTTRRKFFKQCSLATAAMAAGTFEFSQAKNQLKSMSKTTNKGMIHNVYFWLKEEVTDGQKKEFEQGIKDFIAAVDEIQKAEIGKPAGTPDRDVVDHSFAYSLFVWFKSVDDHNTYQHHAAHKVFIDKYAQLWSKVQVLDTELI